APRRRRIPFSAPSFPRPFPRPCLLPSPCPGAEPRIEIPGQDLPPFMSQPARRYFGTDGIRAKANVPPLVPDLVARLVQAAAEVFLARRRDSFSWPVVVIGKDTRQSCDMLESAITAGLASRGIDVRLVGVIPTPAVAMLTREEGAAFGIVVSASHNPFEDNGIKFFGPDGYKLDDA